MHILYCPGRWIPLFLIFVGALSLYPQGADASTRVALVIGNGAYRSITPLANPTNDATDMGVALRSLGFEVITQTDSSHRAMEASIETFSRKLRRADIGLFYYAGHGIQVDGVNYLLPVDLQTSNESSEADVKYHAVNANYVVAKMRDANSKNLNVIILDACRNNPFRSYRSFRSQGLARIEGASGTTLIAYSTAEGSFAADGVGRNSVYTKHLLKRIRHPGLDLLNVFNEVSNDVSMETNGQQKPWTEHPYVNKVFLAGRGDGSLPAASDKIISQGGVSASPVNQGLSPWWIAAGLAAGSIGSAGFLLLRPKQGRKHAKETQQSSVQPSPARNQPIEAVVPPSPVPPKRPAKKEVPPEPVPKVQPRVNGAVLSGTDLEIVLAPGPRQGIGRGEQWPFSISDPHISRKPHCWLGFAQGRPVLSRDGGEVLVNGEPFTYGPLAQGDELQLGSLTTLTVQRIVGDQAIMLNVSAGPGVGKILVLVGESLSLADLFGQQLLPGRLQWEKGQLLLSVSGSGKLPLLRATGHTSQLQLQDGDILEINEQQVMVNLLKEQTP